MSWSTAPDLKAQVMRLWERGELLREGLNAATSRFPLRLTLKTPGPDDITRRFDAVRAWIAAISATPHVRLEWQETRHKLAVLESALGLQPESSPRSRSTLHAHRH